MEMYNIDRNRGDMFKYLWMGVVGQVIRDF